MVKCKKCGKGLTSEMKFCASCGTAVTPEAPTVPSTLAPTPASTPPEASKPNQTTPELLAMSQPGMYTDGVKLAVIHTRPKISFLALFNNGMVGQYNADGKLQDSFNAHEVTNIETKAMSGGAAKFTVNGVEKCYTMDITFRSDWTMPLVATVPAAGLASMMKSIGVTAEFFQTLAAYKDQTDAVPSTTPLPPTLSVPNYGAKVKGQAKGFFWAGGIILGIFFLLLLLGVFAWLLGFLGVMMIVGGFVRLKRAK